MDLAGCTVVYGGSFNPPHVSHQLACLYLLEGRGAAAVWLIPAAVHPFAKALIPFAHRLQMCRLLARPFGEHVRVLETERELGGRGRTYDTLVHLTSHFPEQRFVLAVGADILAETHLWYRWDAITALVPVVVIGRSGYSPPPGEPDVPLPDVSSTEIRRRLAAGESVQGLVPMSVAEYITAHGLYGETP